MIRKRIAAEYQLAWPAEARQRRVRVVGRWSVVALLVLVLAPPAARSQDLAQPIPLDSSIRTGTLPNGFTYFIRKNSRPAKRASIRLAVNAGSIDETDQQRGLAHVI